MALSIAPQVTGNTQGDGALKRSGGGRALKEGDQHLLSSVITYGGNFPASEHTVSHLILSIIP